MKVYIGGYRNWVGPYQIAGALKYLGASDDKVHAAGGWLDKTWIGTFCNWIESKRKRTTYIRIDEYDTWSMDHTLALIIVPMLKQLQATKHGSPFVYDKDVPNELKSTAAPPKENKWDTDDNHFKRWDYVLDEMIWSFEQLIDYESTAKFYEHVDTDKEDFILGRIGKLKVDRVGLKTHIARQAKGLALFGKYYRNLWD
jgi:hypothetical protein